MMIRIRRRGREGRRLKNPDVYRETLARGVGWRDGVLGAYGRRNILRLYGGVKKMQVTGGAVTCILFALGLVYDLFKVKTIRVDRTVKPAFCDFCEV